MPESFKESYSLEARKNEAVRIAEKYPNRIPVIVERAKKSDIPELDKRKYLVPTSMTIGQFTYIIRKHIELSSEEGIFLFVNNVLPSTSARIGTIYDEYKDIDNFLYFSVDRESVFG